MSITLSTSYAYKLFFTILFIGQVFSLHVILRWTYDNPLQNCVYFLKIMFINDHILLGVVPPAWHSRYNTLGPCWKVQANGYIFKTNQLIIDQKSLNVLFPILIFHLQLINTSQYPFDFLGQLGMFNCLHPSVSNGSVHKVHSTSLKSTRWKNNCGLKI